MFEAMIELGSIDAAAQWIDPVSEGKVDVGNHLVYEARATLEMLRGNLDNAQQCWVNGRRLPLRPLGIQVEAEPQEVELHLWCGAPAIAFEQSYALLIRSAEADQGTLAGPLLPFAGRLLFFALRGCADRAEQARADRDAEALSTARRRADQLSDLHRRVTPDPFTPGPLRPTATADNATWQAEWSRLRGESDPALWEQAAAAWDQHSRPHRAAYARWRQAEALLHEPRGRTSAATVLRQASGQAEQHVPLSTAIHDLARMARIDLGTPSDSAAGPPIPAADDPLTATRRFGLTHRELAVLSLLCEGKTNPEIAAALFMSAKTASVHVTHIFRKLDVTTRVQAATVAERAGLLDRRGPRQLGQQMR